jgi:hypothetical protein
VEELGLFPSLQDKMNYLSDVRVLAELPDWCWCDKMNYLSDVRVLAELPDWSWGDALASFSLTGTGTEGRRPSLFPWPLWCGVGAAPLRQFLP